VCLIWHRCTLSTKSDSPGEVTSLYSCNRVGCFCHFHINGGFLTRLRACVLIQQCLTSTTVALLSQTRSTSLLNRLFYQIVCRTRRQTLICISTTLFGTVLPCRRLGPTYCHRKAPIKACSFIHTDVTNPFAGITALDLTGLPTSAYIALFNGIRTFSGCPNVFTGSSASGADNINFIDLTTCSPRK
jgi:hypothetical protein